MRVIRWIINLAFFIYIWNVIGSSISNGFVSFLLAIVATVAFWVVVGLVLGFILALLGADESPTYAYSSWSSWRLSSAKRIEAPPAPAPTAESQMSWDEKMRNGGRMAPPE